MKYYKGGNLNKNGNMECRGFEFKEGETYVEEKATLCKTDL